MDELSRWKTRKARKPLIIRGARQVGKTSLVERFGETFETVVTLNLELSEDRKLWSGEPSITELLRAIEITKGRKIIAGKTLLSIDEIQFQPAAIRSLRYFHENIPELHVIATGSLLEVALKNRGFSFPVGRVEFLYLYPTTFAEFLRAVGRSELADEINTVGWNSRVPQAVHDLAQGLFNEYAFVGGMPEAVQIYAAEKSWFPLTALKESLIVSFEEDVPKYCTPAQAPYVQLLIRQAPLFAGQRIQYENFAGSGYHSREMKRAFEILEQAMIVQRIAGSTAIVPPRTPNLRASPNLLFLDTGLVCHRMGVDPVAMQRANLNDMFRGSIAEQVTGQEILALNRTVRDVPHFWYRNKPGATAETDFTVMQSGNIIPVEVKSGKSGRLRSLLQCMREAPHATAVRIYAGELRRDEVDAADGKRFHLLNVPFYLVHQLPRLLREQME